MNYKILMVVFASLLAPVFLQAQSVTTDALRKKHSDALELFFYNNTLRMLNQSENREFDEIIKDIEKMRFLMIKKDGTRFGSDEYKKLKSDYRAEAFEEIMTSRHDGKNFEVYLKENNGKTKGMLVLINDADNLYVLDILGRIALDKVTKLYSTLDQSTDISSKIKTFAGDDDDNDDDDNENGDEKSHENH